MSTNPGASPGSTPPPPPPGRPTPRKLVRHPDHGPLGGVCAGVADYLNIDPTIVRIAAIVLAFTGPGVPAYILAWIFVPADDGHVMAPWPHTGHRRGDRTSQIVGIALIAIVVSVLWGDWWRPHPGWFVPVGLIGVGAWLLLRNHDDDAMPPAPPAPPTSGPSPPWQPTGPTTPLSVTPAPSPPAGATEPTTDEPTTDTTDDPPMGTDTMDTTQLTDDPDTAVTDSVDADGPDTDTTSVFEPPPPPGDGPTAAGWASPDAPVPAYVPRPRRRRVLGPVVFGALLLWSGIAWLTGISLANGLAAGLCLVGAGFVVGAFIGGSKALILPALLIGAALIVVSTVDIPLGSGIGDRHWTVTAVRDLEPSYDLGIGDATLDLRDMPLPANGTIDVSMKVGIGHITVIVPEDAALQIDTKAGAGSSEVLGREEGGTSVETHRTVKGVTGAGKLQLDLKVGLGRIDVRQESSDVSIGSSDFPPASTPTTPTTAPPASTPVTPLTPAQP
jgi:phage shock protein PspC (stress-responsive transcriptional regulator)/predicted membrane protein